jgi:thiol-disulfide isomerase/thioredoxin
MKKLSVITSVTACIMAACLVLTVKAASLKSGDRFPDAHQYPLEGTLPELKGKVVLVDFWASWCAPCRASFPALQKLSDQYGAKGLVIIGVSVDEKKSEMEKFLQKNKVSFAIVRDAAHKLVATAGVETMPTSMLIDTEGKIRFVHNGFFGEKTIKEYQHEIESLLGK